jgi:hypothetical protein
MRSNPVPAKSRTATITRHVQMIIVLSVTLSPSQNGFMKCKSIVQTKSNGELLIYSLSLSTLLVYLMEQRRMLNQEEGIRYLPVVSGVKLKRNLL